MKIFYNSLCCSFLVCLTLFNPVKAQDLYTSKISEAQPYIQAKDYIKAAQFYSEAFSSNHNLGRPDHRYEAARLWALGDETDSAFYQLDRVVKAGYRDYLTIRLDTAFDSLHNTIRWNNILDSIRANGLKTEEARFKNINKRLALLLDTVHIDDQLYRLQMSVIEFKYGWDSPEMAAVIALIDDYDKRNVQKVTNILDEYGWLGKEDIGEQGNETLFLVIQHSDLATQERYLPMISQAVKDGKAKPSSLALLEDRIALRQGKEQLYGSQIIRDDKTGKYYVQPLVDPENVDKRRDEVGLQPIAEYVRQWGIVWSIEQYNRDIKKYWQK
ncbi:DUF6624 domain-containing protein [Parapedobacter koreensis]|uniref:Tetratricopeptide repeat-containing protein n=1 Tax=Parapedobacter koreensis TaxID=332977 RepID=A0A1H7GB18_9SPHI|nr:DUF6624 domain-containing protein [Parapedobacter koreensis]SEK35264.1 hypothetical protein SAMN05421740_101632 [Parapedobacter koreensis]